MRINKVYQNYINNFRSNTTGTVSYNAEQNPKKDIPKSVIYGALGAGMIILGSLYYRTSGIRIRELMQKELEYTKKTKQLFANSSKIVEIISLENDSTIASIDELSGLERLKEFINMRQLLNNNKDVMNEHNVDTFFSMLFWGVPGTGKTVAAEGIAKKLGADFVRIDRDLFDSELVSVGPRKLVEVFDTISEHALSNPDKPLVVFMDEFDSVIGVHRGLNAKTDDFMVNTFKQALTDIQNKCKNVIFIGATNKDPAGIKSDNSSVQLNSAILSRLKYQFEFKLPDIAEIKDIWMKATKTQSGVNKFTEDESDIIAQTFKSMGLSYRDIVIIKDDLNIRDAVEFCDKKAYNSKQNLIKAMRANEKLGYDPVVQKYMGEEKKEELISYLEKHLGLI